MIRMIEQKEINELSAILAGCGIIPLSLATKLLQKRGKDARQIGIIINQMVKRKLAYYDDSVTYLRVNKGYTLKDLSPGKIKSLWLFLDIIEDVSTYFFQYKNPHNLSFQKKNLTDSPEKDCVIYDIFYFKYGCEALDCYTVNNTFNSPLDSKINAFIIIDEASQIRTIEQRLNKNINVISFVEVSPSGEVSYCEFFDSETEEV